MNANDIDRILARAVDGERLSEPEALLLLENAELAALGEAADAVCRKKHPGNVRTYIVDRNVNYTNVCITYCSFCAFYRRPGAPDAYVRSRDELRTKIEETIEAGGTQILMQGGHHPDLPLEWYEDLLRWIHDEFDLHVHAFSPPEICHFAEVSGLPRETVLDRLIDAGLDSLPGGGGEILVDSVRAELARLKCDSDDWLGVMEAAHARGLRSSATMMYGHVESLADRIEHMRKIREMQDRTGGFIAFISWTYQSEHAPRRGRTLGAHAYLRTQAVSRLYLDNVDNIQSSWVTQGPEIGQVALRFGANDMGSIMMEENVVSAAGTTYRLSHDRMRRVIRDAGFEPRQRDFFYRPVTPGRARRLPLAV